MDLYLLIHPYIRADVLLMIAEADGAISALKGSSVRERTAFAVLVVLKNRFFGISHGGS